MGAGSRLLSKNEILNHLLAVSSKEVGEYVQPMIDGNRLTVRITERIEEINGMIPSLVYKGIDCNGKHYAFLPMDDPRSSTEEKWEAERIPNDCSHSEQEAK